MTVNIFVGKASSSINRRFYTRYEKLTFVIRKRSEKQKGAKPVVNVMNFFIQPYNCLSRNWDAGTLCSKLPKSELILDCGNLNDS